MAQTSARDERKHSGFAQIAQSAAGIAFAGYLVWLGGATGTWSHVAVAIAVTAITTWVSCIDIAQHRIPNRIIVPALLICAGIVTLVSLTSGDPGGAVRALAGGAGCFLALFTIAMIAPRSFGGGDIKLIALTGLTAAWFSWAALILAILSAFVLAGLFSAGSILTRRATGTSSIAFGPFLTLGMFVGIGVTTVVALV